MSQSTRQKTRWFSTNIYCDQKAKRENITKFVLELNHLSLSLLVATDLEVFASLDGNLLACLALTAFHAQHNLLGGLGLLAQNGLRLTTKALLLAIVTTTALCRARLLALLVLSHLVQSVLLAFAFAEGTPSLGDVHHL